MKKMFLVYAVVLIVGVAGIANASLFDRGGGLIYDSDQDITWLQDANYAKTTGYISYQYQHDIDSDKEGLSLRDAQIWADQLVYGIYDDWRLPTVDTSTVLRYANGLPQTEYNNDTSEMGYMYYVNLGNLGAKDTNGDDRPEGTYGLSNTGPFSNLTPELYWTGTYAWLNPDEGKYHYFDFDMGTGASASTAAGPGGYAVHNLALAWAVRDGDVPAVPIPGAMWLFGSGLIGLVGFRRKFRKV